LGSGMTGGLVYAVRKSLAATDYNAEFVRVAEIGEEERAWLRKALTEHVRLTDSSKAKRLIKAGSNFLMVRLEPLHLPCSVAQTWAPILERWEQREAKPIIAQAARSGGSGARIEAAGRAIH
jgi:hypothetical protein